MNRYRTLHNVKQPDVTSGVRPETKLLDNLQSFQWTRISGLL